MDLNVNLEKTRTCLKKWSKEEFRNVERRKLRLIARLSGIQKCLANACNPGLIKLERNLKNQLDVTLFQEELMWYQRLRENWIASGVRNTKFYHVAATVCKAKMRIRGLKDSNERLVEDMEATKGMVFNFYSMLFTDDNVVSAHRLPRNKSPKISRTEWDKINAPFKGEEIKRALFEISPYKAPRPDRFHAGFYKKASAKVGSNVIEHNLEFINTGVMKHGLNDTLIALIPKVSTPEYVKDVVLWE